MYPLVSVLLSSRLLVRLRTEGSLEFKHVTAFHGLPLKSHDHSTCKLTPLPPLSLPSPPLPQGPLSFFNAKQRWTAPRSLRLVPEAGELGFTLKGEPPVQVVSLNPSCAAAVSLALISG